MVKLASHCVPVKVNGIGRTGSDEHLTCYKTKDAPGEAPFAKPVITATDALGAHELRLVKPARLCVFSRKVGELP